MSSATRSVLVVEDDPDINALIGAYVELSGYGYDPVHDGTSAVVEAERRPHAAVILDLMLPGLNGFEVCRRLREMPATAATPVIILSAMGDPETRARTKACGADEHLVKPFDPDHLMEVLRRHAGDPLAA